MTDITTLMREHHGPLGASGRPKGLTDTAVVQYIIDKTITEEGYCSMYYVPLEIGWRFSPPYLYDKAERAGRLSNNGIRNINAGAKRIWHDSWRRLKHKYSVDGTIIRPKPLVQTCHDCGVEIGQPHVTECHIEQPPRKKAHAAFLADYEALCRNHKSMFFIDTDIIDGDAFIQPIVGCMSDLGIDRHLQEVAAQLDLPKAEESPLVTPTALVEVGN